MGERGRKSQAALTVIGPGGVETIRRPEPPPELTDEQAEEWTSVVTRLPADWFPRETHAMLSQYCRHIVRARRIAKLIEATERCAEFDVKEYRDLLRSEEEQSRAIASLATKMRISQQTTYDKSKKKPQGGKRPWDIDG
jgi:hypothetical protein